VSVAPSAGEMAAGVSDQALRMLRVADHAETAPLALLVRTRQ